MEEALADADALAGRQAEYARALRARGEQLETALTQTRQACGERDRRIAYLEAELDLSRADAERRLRALAALGSELEALRVSARGQATRIRLQALREAAAVSAAARRLGAAEEGAAGAGIAAVLERALERLGAEWEGEGEGPDGAESPRAPAAAANGGGPVPTDAGNGPGPAVHDASPSPHRISVDVGPFRDFSQLASFEDAANAIGAAGEISIRRFSAGRASIDIDLDEPVDLLRELEQRCDLEFEVRARGEDEIVLDLGE